MTRSTHTYVVLELSAPAYGEIKRKLLDAGYEHAIDSDGVIDMHGIAVNTIDKRTSHGRHATSIEDVLTDEARDQLDRARGEDTEPQGS